MNKKLTETELTAIVKKSVKAMVEDSEFDYGDLMEFASMLEEINTINQFELKPHLVIWHINRWEHIGNFIFYAMEEIGYEWVGTKDSVGEKFNFEYQDYFYSHLFRFKDKYCDYTKIYKVGE